MDRKRLHIIVDGILLASAGFYNLYALLDVLRIMKDIREAGMVSQAYQEGASIAGDIFIFFRVASCLVVAFLVIRIHELFRRRR